MNSNLSGAISASGPPYRESTTARFIGKILIIMLLVALGHAGQGSVTSAQSCESKGPQNESPADAARHNLQEKKNLIRRSRVTTDDDLDLQFFRAARGGVESSTVADVHGTLAIASETPVREVNHGPAIAVVREVSAPSGGIYIGSPPTLQTGPPDPTLVAALQAADWVELAATEPPTRRPNESDDDFEIAKLKAQIASAELHLNLRQRALALDQDTIYSNPNYLVRHTGKSILDAEQERIDARQREIEEVRAHLALLEGLERQSKQTLSARQEIAGPLTNPSIMDSFCNWRLLCALQNDNAVADCHF